MARFRTKTISRRTVEALKVEKDTVFWDRDLPGFGVRVYPSGRKVYIAQARAKGKAAQRVVCELAGIEDARIHDCRHSFASRALALGENLPMIGRLLGHSEEQTTERYAHLDRDWVREGAIRISESTVARRIAVPAMREQVVRAVGLFPGHPDLGPELDRDRAGDGPGARPVRQRGRRFALPGLRQAGP